MPISNTIQEFRQNVLGRGGPQISGKYIVIFEGPAGYLTAYPMSIIIPGRQFVYYEHDLWGPNRKVPYKRGYTQCHMTFIAYQDWAERKYIEDWMDTVVHNKSDGENTNPSVLGQADPALSIANAESAVGFIKNFVNGSLAGNANFNMDVYNDWINYKEGTGTIFIECLSNKDDGTLEGFERNALNLLRFSEPNMRLQLEEAFPAAISQMSLTSDGSGYPTYNVTFQFNDYIFR